MTLDILPLIDCSLSRARDEHVSALLAILNKTISVIHTEQQATILESLKLFQTETFRALNEYASRARQAVLSNIESTNVAFTSEDKSEVLSLVQKYVEPSLYIARFTAYESAVARHVAKFGSPFQLSAFRVDLIKAAYEVSTINTIRRFLADLSDDLEIVVQRQKHDCSPVDSSQEGKLEQVNRLIKLEPNVFGIGLNLNYLIRRLIGKRE